MRATTTWQDIAWFGLGFSVPADWDVVGHSSRRDRGRLVFRDRRQQRLLVTWAATETAPDAERLWHDYRAADLEADEGCRFEANLPPDWQGYRRRSGDDLTRAGRYDEASGRWLEFTFSGPGTVGSPDEAAVLVSFHTDAAPHWRAFGIDLRTPQGWELVGTRVQVGEARFELRRGAATATVVRHGLSDLWLHGSLAEWWRGRGNKQRDLRQLRFAGHDACAAAWHERPPGFRGLVQCRRRRLLLWHDRADRAVYEVSVSAPRREATIESDDRAPAGFDVQPAPSPPTRGRKTAEPACPVLDVVPVRNRAIEERREGDRLQLAVPMQPRWYMQPPFSAILPFSRQRCVQLDGLGVEVWDCCDGNRRVEEVIDEIAANHAMGFAETRVAVTTFLQQLMRRGCIGLVGDEQPARAQRRRAGRLAHA